MAKYGRRAYEAKVVDAATTALPADASKRLSGPLSVIFEVIISASSFFHLRIDSSPTTIWARCVRRSPQPSRGDPRIMLRQLRLITAPSLNYLQCQWGKTPVLCPSATVLRRAVDAVLAGHRARHAMTGGGGLFMAKARQAIDSGLRDGI